MFANYGHAKKWDRSQVRRLKWMSYGVFTKSTIRVFQIREFYYIKEQNISEQDSNRVKNTGG